LDICGGATAASQDCLLRAKNLWQPNLRIPRNLQPAILIASHRLLRQRIQLRRLHPRRSPPRVHLRRIRPIHLRRRPLRQRQAQRRHNPRPPSQNQTNRKRLRVTARSLTIQATKHLRNLRQLRRPNPSKSLRLQSQPTASPRLKDISTARACSRIATAD